MIRLLLVFDASPIIAFFGDLNEVDDLLALRERDYRLVVPEYVCTYEIIKDPAASLLRECVRRNEMESIAQTDQNIVSEFRFRHPSLGIGESEVILSAIRLSREQGPVICIIDDGPARKVAVSSGLVVKGTIGLINHMTELAIVDEQKAATMKQRLAKSSFRIDNKLLY